MGILEQGRETQSVADNLGRRDTFRFLKRKSEALKLEAGPTQLVKWNKGTVAMWNVAQFQDDVWNGTLGDRDVVGVVNNNNVFLEYLWHDRFVDGSTSATMDYANHTVTFGDGEVFQSGTVFANDESVQNARIKLNTSNVTGLTNLTFAYCQDSKWGGDNWTELTHDSSVSLSGTGTTLAFRMTCSGTALISVDSTTGVPTPIKIFYNE